MRFVGVRNVYLDGTAERAAANDNALRMAPAHAALSIDKWVWCLIPADGI